MCLDKLFGEYAFSCPECFRRPPTHMVAWGTDDQPWPARAGAMCEACGVRFSRAMPLDTRVAIVPLEAHATYQSWHGYDPYSGRWLGVQDVTPAA